MPLPVDHPLRDIVEAVRELRRAQQESERHLFGELRGLGERVASLEAEDRHLAEAVAVECPRAAGATERDARLRSVERWRWILAGAWLGVTGLLGLLLTLSRLG